jgi:hypothetical protein
MVQSLWKVFGYCWLYRRLFWDWYSKMQNQNDKRYFKEQPFGAINAIYNSSLRMH